MKNALKPVFKIFAVAILLFGITGCDGCKPEPEPDENGQVELKEPKGIVPVAEAKSLYQAYETFRVKIIEDFENSGAREKLTSQNQIQQRSTGVNSRDKDFIAAQYISFQYDSIKKYLKYIEQEAELSGKEITGLRFYFANYPDKEKFESNDKIRFPKQNSIMISPTIRRGKQESIFYTVDAENGKRRVVFLEDDFMERGKMPQSEIEGQGNFDENTINQTSEASFFPNLKSYSNLSPVMFEGRSTTYNRGHGSPPTQ